MEVVKKEEKYTIYKKRSGRFAIKETKGSWLIGDPKVELLVKAGLVKAAPVKKKEEAPAAETPADAEEASASE